MIMDLNEYRASCLLHGMPCHKYIVRNLNNTRDAIIFEKSFVKTMLSNGFSEDDVLCALDMMSQYIPANSPIAGQEFNLTGDGIDMGSLLLTLQADVTVPEYTCKEYLGKFDESCTSCTHCIYSTDYRNSLEDAERTVLRYILHSEKNLTHLKSLGLKAGLFHSVVDVVDVIASAKHPINYMLYRTIYKTINASAGRYYGSQDVGTSLGIKVRTKIADDVYRFSLPKECYQNNWHNKLVAAWEEDIFSIPLCDADAAESALNQLLTKVKYVPPVCDRFKKPRTRGAVSAISATAATAAQHRSKKVVCSDDVSKSAPHSVASDVKNTTTQPDKSIAKTFADDSRAVSGAAAANALKKKCSKDVGRKESKTEYFLSTDYVEVVSNDDESVMDAIPAEAKVVNKYDTFPRNIDMGGNLIYVPRIKRAELDYCAVGLNHPSVRDLTVFENAVLRDKRLPLEMVYDEDYNEYLLMWVPSLHTYFYSSFVDDRANEILLSLLSRRGITKIIYSPYWLYSTLYHRNNGQLREVLSIQTAHYILSRSQTDYVGVLLSYGVKPAMPDTDFKSRRWVDSLIFRLMPTYTHVYRKQMRQIDSRSLTDELTELSYFNEAVGTSYSMKYWFGRDGFLYSMPNPFFFSFQRVDFYRLSVDGYVLSYDLMYEKEPPVPIFRSLLCRLAEGGRFRVLRMQLIDVSETSLVLFIVKPYFEVATEFIERAIFDVLDGKREYGISFETKYRLVEHERISSHS